MPKLWDILSPLSKVNLARVYKKLSGLDFQPPKDEKKCEVQIDPEEVEEIMQEPGRGAWHE